MRKILVLGMVFWSFLACNKDSQDISGIVGKWKLSAIFIQTSGPGNWHSTDSLPASFIQFNKDGTLTMSPYVSYLYNNADRYQVTGDSTFTFFEANGTTPATYFISDTLLTINPGCIEGCAEKFISVQ